MKNCLQLCIMVFLLMKDVLACLDVNWDVGKCVPVNKCAPLSAIAEGSHQITAQEMQILVRVRRCGYEGSLPLVCCSLDDVLSTNRSVIHTSEKTNPTTPAETSRYDHNGTRVTDASAPLHITEDVAQNFSLSTHLNRRILPSARRLDCGDSLMLQVTHSESQIGSHPWLVVLGHNSTRDDRRELEYPCVGSLISSQYVLTAAVCVSDDLAFVRLGRDHQQTVCPARNARGCSGSGRDLEISEVTIHPMWNGTPRQLENNIALIRLAQPVNFSPCVSPVCLPWPDEQLQNRRQQKYLNGASFDLDFYGYTDGSCLRYTSHRRQSDRRCRLRLNRYLKEEILGAGPMCVTSVVIPNSLDIGGPLLEPTWVFTQEGVASFKYLNHPNEIIYVNITHHLGWILDSVHE